MTKTLRQFSLRSLLIVTLVCACAATWWSNRNPPEQFVLSRSDITELTTLAARMEVTLSWEWRPGDPWDASKPSRKPGQSPVHAVDGDAWSTTDEDLELVSRFPSIQYVHLAYCCRITDEGIAHLAKLPSLRTLVLYRTSAKYGGNSIPISSEAADKWPQRLTDKALDHIRKMPALEVLDISSNHFSEEAILKLGEVKTLRRLDFDPSLVSESGMAQLRAALPNCKIRDY